MKKKTLLSEVRQLQKIAGILKEAEDFKQETVDIQGKLQKGFNVEFPSDTMFTVYSLEGIRQFINYDKVFTGNKADTLKYLTEALLSLEEQIPEAFEEFFGVYASTEGYEFLENIKSLDIPYDEENGFLVVAAEDAEEAEKDLDTLA